MNRFVLAIPFLIAAPAFAHDPITTQLTWTREISRLIYGHCAACHHAGGSAMSLTTYSDARPWAKAIRDEVLERRMPPWDAVKGVGQFRNDSSLSQPEMDLFVAWVEGGAPEGDRASLPHDPDFSPTPEPELPRGQTLRVTGKSTLRRPTVLLGIRPEGPLEVTACLPDGTVNRLLWVRNFRPEWNRNYLFRNPMVLPRGTQIIVYSRANSAARLLTKTSPEL